MIKSKDSLTYSFLFLLGILGFALISDSFILIFKDALGSNHQKNEKPDAIILSGKNDIRRRGQTEIAWESLLQKQGLFLGDEIFVGENSEISFLYKNNELLLKENSLLRLDTRSSLFQLSTGYISFNLNHNETEKLELKIGDEDVSISGKGSSVSISKVDSAGTNVIGISIEKGEADLSLNRGESKLRGIEGSNLIVSRDRVNGKLVVRKAQIRLVTPRAETYFLKGSKADFKWSVGNSEKELEVVASTIEVSDNISFSNMLFQKNTKQESASWGVPDQNLKLYWRVSVKTKDGLILKSKIEQFFVYSPRPPKIYAPIFTFVSPKDWKVTIHIEEPFASRGTQLNIKSDDGDSSKNISGSDVEFFASPQKILKIFAESRFPDKDIVTVSETFTYETPRMPDTPSSLSYDIFKAAKGTKVKLSWKSDEKSTLHQVRLKKGMNSREEIKIAKSPNIEFTCDEETFLTATVSSFYDENVYGLSSAPITIPACPPQLLIEDVQFEPPLLSRFHSKDSFGKYAKLNLKIQNSLKTGTYLLEVIKDGKVKEIKSSKNLTFILDPQGYPEQFRLKPDLDKKKYFTVWSDKKTLRLPPPDVPPRPELIMPKYGEMQFVLAQKEGKILFSWSSAEGIQGYDFQISKSPEFSPEPKAIVVRQPRVELKSTLSNGTYYWRVRAFNKHFESPWSEPNLLRIVREKK